MILHLVKDTYPERIPDRRESRRVEHYERSVRAPIVARTFQRPSVNKQERSAKFASPRWWPLWRNRVSKRTRVSFSYSWDPHLSRRTRSTRTTRPRYASSCSRHSLSPSTFSQQACTKRAPHPRRTERALYAPDVIHWAYLPHGKSITLLRQFPSPVISQ